MRYGKVAITIRSFEREGPAMERLREHYSVVYTNDTGNRLTEDALCRVLPGVNGVIAGTEPFTSRVLDASEDLRVIARVGVGLDSVDLEAASRHGILVTTTPNAPVQAVAEHTLALLLAVLKQIPQYNDALRKGISMTRSGSLLAGKHVGVIGLGRIGTRVADMLESLGCSISYYDPFVKEPARKTWQKRETLTDLVAGADILTLHAPAQAGHRPLLDAAVLGSCKKGIIIINSARGSLINEDAMISALADGTIAGAGLDVFPSEPYTGPLLSYPQVIATPHVASHTLETRTQMEQEAVEKVISALTGGRK